MNAIDSLEMMSRAETDVALYCPFVFGYSNYSRLGFRERLLRFRDIIPLGANGTSPAGSLLGGVGLGVSAKSPRIKEAVRFTEWIAGAEVQRGVFAASGGQPAHRAAWDDPKVDSMAGGFFSGVRRTIDESWTRPRVPGYVEWQNASMTIVHQALRSGSGFDSAVKKLNHLAVAIGFSAQSAGPQR
jgi:multiple sugar transport system substrate-binding protein